MAINERRVRFAYSVEASVAMEPTIGKWTGKYRYVVNGVDSLWLQTGTQFNSRSEAASSVLSTLKSLVPELQDDWIATARAELLSD